MKIMDWLHRKLTEDFKTPARAEAEAYANVGGAARPLPVGEEPPPPYAPRFEQIANRFTDHAPTDTQTTVYKILRRQGKELGFMIEQYCPESEEKTAALNRLDEAVMHANAAIARHS